MAQAKPPHDAGLGKSAPSIAAELKQQVKARRRSQQRSAAWSIPVGTASDSELDKVLEILARMGVQGT